MADDNSEVSHPTALLSFDKAPCRCVMHHVPKPLTTEQHHIWPIYLGGPERGEKVPLCGTTHNNVHAILDDWLKGKPTPKYVNSYALWIATRGMKMAKAAGRWNPKTGVE